MSTYIYPLYQFSFNLYYRTNMTRYTPNSRNVSSTLETFPKDTYELKVTNFKAVKRVSEKDGQQKTQTNMQVVMEHSTGPFAGKKVIQTFYNVEPGGSGEAFLKNFMMALYGYQINKDGENKYNNEVLPTKDESFDDETGEVGSLYKDAIGYIVVGDATVKLYEGKEQNQWTWRPLKSAS